MKHSIGWFALLTAGSLGLGLALRHVLTQSQQATVDFKQTIISLPLEDYGGHLFLQAQVNGHRAQHLILDSGASDLFISASLAQTLQLQPQQNTYIPGASRNIDTAFVPAVSFTLGALTLHDHQSVILPQAEVSSLQHYFGRPVDGILGYELFEQAVVEVDYAQHTLRLHQPQTYRYQGTGQRLPLILDGDRPYIAATITPYGFPPLQSRLMIDLGSNAALSIAPGCGLDQRLIAAAPRTLKRSLINVHGTESITLGRVQNLQLGSVTVTQPITLFGRNPTGNCDRLEGKLGYPILRQFTVIFNYAQRELILEPNPAQPSPFLYDLSGLQLEAIGAGLKTYRIHTVIANTPAAQAGLQAGDTLIALNDIATTKLTLAQIRHQLSQPHQIMRLTTQRGTRQTQTRLTLQPLL